MTSILADEAAQLETGAADPRPLTDQERALLTRLLSDPFAIPQPFKTWLISFLEGSDLLLPRSSVQGLSLLLGSGGGTGIFGLLPAGMIFPYGGATAPQGTVLCNGQSLAREGQYNRLFKAIGTTYGSADANSFSVPDLRRRLPFGAGTSMGLGASDGRAETSRHIKHHHDVNQTTGSGGSHSHGGSTDTEPDHSHTVPVSEGSGSHIAMSSSGVNIQAGTTGGFFMAVTGRSAGLGNAGAHNHSISTDTHGGHQHNLSGPTTGGFDTDQPSFLVVGFIINF